MVLRQTEEEINHSPSSDCRIHFLTSLPCWLRLTQSLFLSPCSALPCWLCPTKFLLNPAMLVTLYPVPVPLCCVGYALTRFCSTLPCWLRPTQILLHPAMLVTPYPLRLAQSLFPFLLCVRGKRSCLFSPRGQTPWTTSVTDLTQHHHQPSVTVFTSLRVDHTDQRTTSRHSSQGLFVSSLSFHC